MTSKLYSWVITYGRGQSWDGLAFGWSADQAGCLVPCTSSLTSGEPQGHSSVMAKGLLAQHHPGPSLVCPGSTRKGSPGHGWQGLPALGAACAWACLAWWCAEEHNQGCLGLHRFYFQAGNAVRANYEEIFQQTHFSLKSWLRWSLQVAVEEHVWQGSVAHRAALAAQWCRSGARLGSGWAPRCSVCLIDTWQPVHSEFLPLWYFCWRSDHG